MSNARSSEETKSDKEVMRVLMEAQQRYRSYDEYVLLNDVANYKKDEDHYGYNTDYPLSLVLKK